VEARGEKASSEELRVRVVVDFGGLVTRHTLNDAIDCVKGIIAKWGETYYSRKLRKGKPFSLTAITAFNLDSLDEDAVRALVGLHKQVVVSTRNGVSTLALNFRTRKGPEVPGVEVASKEVLEEFVKRHLETVVLSMLRERPMCGYDVIKTIYQRYHTFLSQGTVYPLLYSLEGRGLLAVAKAEGGRSKVYTLTDEGKRAAEREVQEFVKAQRYLLESIRK
jgi:DNA-binding PadR family transcriptional regulator